MAVKPSQARETAIHSLPRLGAAVMASLPNPEEILTFGAFEAHVRPRELFREGARVRLPDQSFLVLAMLLEHPGELVTREDIRKRLWPGDTFVDFDHGLNNAVNRLRDALGDSAEDPRFIETLPRRGYRFIFPVHPVVKTESAVTVAEFVDAGAPPGQLGSKKRRYATISIAAAVLLALVLTGVWLRRRPSQSENAPPPFRSLAVLPFENLSGDPSQEYFADGVTDSLITDMAQIRSLRVISRTSAMHYKGSHQALPDIARELNVDVVVEGSVARIDNRVRVTVQLIQAPSDRHLWAQSYERNVSDILQLQSDVARAVALEVASQITPQEQARLAQVRPVNTEAYEAYLKGRYFWNHRTEEDLKKSKEYFERAIQKAPNYAPAYAGLADFHNMSAFSELGWVDPGIAAPKALEAANKALQLDDSLAEAHAALGLTKARFLADYGAAEKEFQRAIELNPGYPNTYIWYAFILGVEGRHDEACDRNRTARQLDPLNPTYIRNVAGCLFDEGKTGEAISEMSAAVELAPQREDTRYSLAYFYEHEGRFAEAIAQYRQLVKISSGGDCERSSLSYALAASGKKNEAEILLNEIKTHPAYPDYAYCLASAYVGLGNRDEAIHLLEEVFRKEGRGALGLMTSEYRFAPLRSDSRFQDLVHRAGLSEKNAGR